MYISNRKEFDNQNKTGNNILAKQKIIQSANFKRNTLTIVAVLLFVLIVISEILLAISIPWYLTRENTMAKEVLRIKLRDSFDAARRLSAGVRDRNEIKQTEMRLVRWSLDGMTDYLRKYTDELNAEELKNMQDTINSLVQIANRIHSKKSYSVDIFD